MKIIELLDKIANGEEVPKKIRYCMTNFKYDTYTNEYLSIEDETNNGNISIFKYIFTPNLNDEVEILEEEKKIPEKLGLTYLKDDDRNNIIDKINEIIDCLHYLKSKGE